MHTDINTNVACSTLTAARASFNDLDVMRFAQHFVFLKRELFARGQLTFARVARETRQMVDVLPGATHPIRRLDVTATFRALYAKLPAEK